MLTRLLVFLHCIALLACLRLFVSCAGSLNLEGKFQREVVDSVDAGVIYKFNE